MTKTLLYLLFICISAFTLDCKTDTEVFHEGYITSLHLDTIIVNFEYGEDFSSSAWKNIYVVWMENTSSDFIQNITICKKLISGGTTGTALPFWKTNKYPLSSSSEIDAVTSATKANTDFTVSAVLKDSTIKDFVLYFEVDRSFEPNDWFSDQPALLYAVNINLEDNVSEYELLPTGWTPNENTQNKIPNSPFGVLQDEMKYITNHKDGESFGTFDERSATRMVKKITATIKKSVATKISSTRTNDFSISIFPNPSYEQVTIKSKEIIQEVVIANIRGQTILHLQPKTFETAFVLKKSIAPSGTYFVKIRTSKEVSIHKLQITDY